jgi:hypothetical protein
VSPATRRNRDPNQLAKRIVGIATDEIVECVPAAKRVSSDATQSTASTAATMTIEMPMANSP